MNMKEYESPATGVIEFIQHNVVCVSYDENHMTEILLIEEEETI